MTPVSDTPVSDVPPTRSRRRSANFPSVTPPPRALRPLVPIVTIALATLMALAAYADRTLLVAAVALVGVTVAVTWKSLLGGPSPTVPTAILTVAALVTPAIVLFTPTDPYLRFVPLVLAAGLMAMFVHQLTRKDGRARLTESVAITAFGLGLVVTGSALIPLTRTLDGREVLVVSCAAVAAGSLGDLLGVSSSLARWQLPAAMLFGGWAAMGMSWFAGAPTLANAVLLGFLVAAVSHALRRLLGGLPNFARPMGQICVAASGLLVVAVLTYAFARVLVG